jgi:2-polyprenyl-6-methoxyphenol hydroxylase-like FAD-dependent oxidoreductase
VTQKRTDATQALAERVPASMTGLLELVAIYLLCDWLRRESRSDSPLIAMGRSAAEALAIAAVAVASAAANCAALIAGMRRSVRRRCLSCDRPTAATLQPGAAASADPGSRSLPAALDRCETRALAGEVMGVRLVLIVGGGIAGLALAPMLARTGVAVEVIEREPAWRSAGTGIYLPGNAARALRALGLEAQVASRAVEIPRQQFCDHHGRLLFEVDVAELWAAVGPCLALRRAELHTILRDAAGDVPIRIGLALERLAQHNGVVSVEFSDGVSGEYDLVVGADGIHSAVRRLTFEPTAVPRPVGQIGWRFLAPRPTEVTTWSVMLGRGRAFLTLPLDGDWVYCYCDVVSPRDLDTAERGRLPRLSELFSQFADPAAALLDALDPTADIHVSTIEEVALDHSAQGHVVLIGDAAHATSPNMAQGAAMALEDALVLTDCLSRIPAIPDALAAFQARRRPRTDWVRAQTHRRDHTRYLPPTMRDNVLRFLGRRIFHANYRPLLDQP